MFVTTLLFLVSACAMRKEAPPVEQPQASVPPPPTPATSVTASRYADDFAGKKTASGDIYSPDQMTAAHKSLPFGTRVRVTNPQNGKNVVVKINDRGPFVKGRELDLSRAAAAALGLMKAGVVEVQMEILEKGNADS